jgi:hypothetical protein
MFPVIDKKIGRADKQVGRVTSYIRTLVWRCWVGRDLRYEIEAYSTLVEPFDSDGWKDALVGIYPCAVLRAFFR